MVSFALALLPLQILHAISWLVFNSTSYGSTGFIGGHDRYKGLSRTSVNGASKDLEELTFELRHQHAIVDSPHGPTVLFADVPPLTPGPSAYPDSSAFFEPARPYTLRTRRLIAHRPTSLTSLSDYRQSRLSLRGSSHDSYSNSSIPLLNFPWEEDEIEGPDVESRETLLLLAKMTNNAYIESNDTRWYDLGEGWNISYPVGWDPTDDGFRGYIFATPTNSTIILSIKGTSVGSILGGEPDSDSQTAKKDKLNDNLLFSCCCAKVGWSWTPVCGCHKGGWSCDVGCLEEALAEESLFYPIGTNLYNNITYMYPHANIWIVGHSLGGALASLLGVTFGVPVVTFESPGEKMAARRLHLPTPPSTQHITHVYHTADPIAMGTCNGVLSYCALGGYAMESKCHLGTSIIYDTVSNASWAVDIRTHTIVNVIERLLSVPWPPAEEIGREVPQPVFEDDCVECYRWEFEDDELTCS